MFDQLSKEAVQRNLELHKQLVRELSPSQALDSGPFVDTVLYYSAIFTTYNQQQIADTIKGQRIGGMIKNPTGVSDKHVDAIAADWFTERKLGKKATGNLAVYVPSSAGLVLPSGTVFTNGTKNFKTKATHILRTNHGPSLLRNDCKLEQTPAGWMAVVPVEAENIGSAYNLRKGAVLRPESRNVHVLRAVAHENFTTGSDDETNAQLLGRLMTASTGRIISNAYTVEAVVAQHMNATCRILGFGCPEMRRANRGIWPGATGGHLDLYVWPFQTTTKTVWLQGERLDEHHVRIRVPREHAAGVWRVVSVTDEHGDNCCVHSVITGFDYRDLESHVDIVHPDDAVFSALQTLSVDVKSQSTGKHCVELYGVDGLLELQKAFLQKKMAGPGCDILVRAPVPFCLTTNVKVQTADQQTIVALREAVAEVINKIGFTDVISEIEVIKELTLNYRHLPSVQRISFNGTLLDGNGYSYYGGSDNELHIPERYDAGISPNTTVFVQEVKNVNIQLER